MNLKKLYANARVTLTSGGWYCTRNKELFGKRAVQFLRTACKIAGIKPDKGYPYFNRGGPAVLGDVYLNITLPDNSHRLEFIFGERLCFETGALYRTNAGKFWNQYGQNIWLKEDATEEDVARLIREFMAERTESNTLETSGVIQ